MSNTRRALLRATALALPAAALGACTLPTGVTLTPAEVISGIGNLAKSFGNALPLLNNVSGIPANVLAEFQKDVPLIQQAANTLGPLVPTNAAAPVVQKIAGWVNAIVQTAAQVGPSVLPPPWPEILAAALVVLPAFEAMVGITPAAAAVSGPVAAFRARLPAMTAAKAEAVLATYAR